MIHSIFGKLEEVGVDYAVINMGGLSFRLFISANTVRLIGGSAEVKLLTHLHVREDALTLFGFVDDEELTLFEMLISVSGIGPRSALSILSLAPVLRLKAAISSGEAELLQKSSGVGKKTAERIVLELKDKISAESFEGQAKTIQLIESDRDVYEALTSLGYTSQQAKETLSKIDASLSETKDRLKEALKILKKN